MSDTPVAAPPASSLGDLFAATATGAVSRSFAWSSQARSLVGLEGWLRGALFLFIAVQAALTLILVALLWVFSVWATPEGVENQQAATIAVSLGPVAEAAPIAAIGIFILCVVAYLWFVYRAMKNLHLSNARGLATSPGWAVGWSFIPIANLGMVYAVMQQIWVVSHDPVRGLRPAPMSLGWWWGLWLVGGVITRISEMSSPQVAGEDPTTYFADFLPGMAIGFVGTICAVVSTFLLMRIVRQIRDAQETLRATSAFED